MTAHDGDLLARLAGNTHDSDDDVWSAVAATQPEHAELDDELPTSAGEPLEDVLARIHGMSAGQPTQPAANPAHPTAAAKLSPTGQPAWGPSDFSPRHSEQEFVPLEPESFEKAGLNRSFVESLTLKFLLSCGDMVGRDIAEQLRLPFVLVEPLLRQMKQDQLVVYRGAAAVNDYIYQLTDVGRERARRHADHCTYYAAAPVALDDYIACVRAQSIEHQHPTQQELLEAFDDLLIGPQMMSRLGPAVNSGRGMFLYGAAGNGKTSIAERITRSFGQYIWIPRAIGIDGTIMRLFDPMNHQQVPLPPNSGLLNQSRIDRRWVRIRRPTIVVGGELTLEHLEVTTNHSTGINEAPLQLKSNCGTLVIDDFGRQRVSTADLLNRWIVPLEKRYDFLNLENGKKIQVPFDQLIVFSTNLEPRDLVDEAFLRRIPYKIEVPNPTEQEFRDLFKLMCPKMGFEFRQEALDYVLDRHYVQAQRLPRFCHPRDLLLQVRNYCLYHKVPLELTNEYFDYAVQNYFAIM
jgi:DNA-binding PadR family transcriptional regulator